MTTKLKSASLMPEFIVDLSNPLVRSLACAAIQQGLHSILIHDIEPAPLHAVAELLAKMLKIVTGREVPCVTLGSIENEDDLWGNLILRRGSDGWEFGWHSKLLPGEGEDSHPRLVLIPDLANISLAAARACVVLVDSELTDLQRYGRSRCIRTGNIWWLAACATNKTNTVSPHLLDRFSMRLHGRMITAQDRSQEILARFSRPFPAIPVDQTGLSADISKTLSRATQYWPEIEQEALSQISEYEDVSSTRRGLALIRFAIAAARLDRARHVSAKHVDIAADIIHLKLPASAMWDTKTDDVDERKPSEPPVSDNTSNIQDSNASNPIPDSGVTDPAERQASPPSSTTESPPFSQSVGSYPEDDKPKRREIDSLRLPIRRYRANKANRGPIIGTEHATNLHDPAWVPTIVEAKFQYIKRLKKPHETKGRLVISRSNLRTYRRFPVPEQMLVLVLDYTSVRKRDWQSALLPHLRWAYVERAGMCLIRVGAADDASEELRAKRILGRSLLVPRISAALEAEAGRATPLAHGLDLALHTLRHSLQHGRSAAGHARLVVMTDGRGNVPLKSSQLNRMVQWPVNRSGINDSLATARKIRALNNVQAVLLNPNQRQYTELPWELKDALNAIYQEMKEQ
ncbi:MAG: hypothetical protein GY862_03860 [Gammaproteobacteria bacterium]|nr:hypothetical protein [Gammaproteobacteria bacterium]